MQFMSMITKTEGTGVVFWVLSAVNESSLASITKSAKLKVLHWLDRSNSLHKNEKASQNYSTKHAIQEARGIYLTHVSPIHIFFALFFKRFWLSLFLNCNCLKTAFRKLQFRLREE